jgi:5-methylthioribose kinase
VCPAWALVQVGPESTWVIDAEFAFYGPIFFDVGKYLGNLLLNFLSLDGRASVADPLDAQRRWVTDSVTEVWRRFSARFVELWDAEGGVEVRAPLARGELYHVEL